jgi:hypothetical protein
MYAYGPKIGGGFFEGVCRLEDQLLTFHDPPPPCCYSRMLQSTSKVRRVSAYCQACRSRRYDDIHNLN